MDNPHMFDELTNRLNKVKRPDSGIHNSGEFIGENDKLDKSEEQVDSGRDSDPAEPADVDATDGSGASKKGGFMKNFKKMFKIRRKSKTGKIKGDKLSDDEKVISSQYKAASEPDIINSGSSKEPSLPRSNTGMPAKRFNDSPNANDFTSDDEDIRPDEKKSTLKDAPGFIRSSLRKLKLKKKKSGGGMDSAEVTPTTAKRTHNDAPPPVSPKKSPKKPRSSSRSSHGSDHTEPISDSYTKDYTESDDGKSSRTDSLSSQPFAVNFKDDFLLPNQPVIESGAARDKIRVAPRGRKRPTRVRTQSKAAEVSEKVSPLTQITEDDSHDGEKPAVIETPKKKEIPKTPTLKRDEDTEQKKSEPRNVKVSPNVDKAFDSVLSSLASTLNKSNESLPKKSPELKTRSPTTPPVLPKTPPVQPKPAKPSREANENARRNTDGSSLTRKSDESTTPAVRRNTEGSSLRNSAGVTPNLQKNTETSGSRKSLHSNKGSVESLNRQSLKNSISLGDLIKETEDITLVPRTRSFQKSIDSSSNEHTELTESVSVKEESPDKSRYDKYRKSRSQTIPDNNVKKSEETVNSKSFEDVSILNKENSRRSGHFIDPVGTFYQKDVDIVNRENFINETRLAMENENIRKSREQLKKSSSRNSLNETTFAITSAKNINAPDPIIPYNNRTSEELSSSPDKPRKLQQRRPGNEKSPKKPRPQSVTIRSTDTSIIFGKVSGARSYGDIRSLIDSPEKEKAPSVPSSTNKTSPKIDNLKKVEPVEKPSLGKSKSVDVQVENVVVKADDVPEFKRMSLRKIPKAEDYLPKETTSEENITNVSERAQVREPIKEPVKEPIKNREENPVFSNMKTSLRHVEPKPSLSETPEVTKKESPELIKKIEKELNNEKISPSPNKKPIETSSSVEMREEKEKPPAFHRISLKKVEKRDDFLGNDKESPKEERKSPSPKMERDEHKPLFSDVKKPTIPTPTPPTDGIKEKPKPPIKAKPFQFQSHDVNAPPENKVEKPKPAPLSQAGKLPYFRKSIDIQENPNPHGNVPAWIAMARERQRDEAPEKTDDDAKTKESVQVSEKSSEDSEAESLVKPSAMMKPKPTPKPKPSIPTKPESTQPSTSQPAVAKKPPPVSQRPSLGRFNAKTDLPNKDACMVCQKTVYVLERCEVNKKTLHRACAKCHVCNRTLNVGDIFISDDKVSCRQHR